MIPIAFRIPHRARVPGASQGGRAPLPAAGRLRRMLGFGLTAILVFAFAPASSSAAAGERTPTPTAEATRLAPAELARLGVSADRPAGLLEILFAPPAADEQPPAAFLRRFPAARYLAFPLHREENGHAAWLAVERRRSTLIDSDAPSGRLLRIRGQGVLVTDARKTGPEGPTPALYALRALTLEPFVELSPSAPPPEYPEMRPGQLLPDRFPETGADGVADGAPASFTATFGGFAEKTGSEIMRAAGIESSDWRWLLPAPGQPAVPAAASRKTPGIALLNTARVGKTGLRVHGRFFQWASGQAILIVDALEAAPEADRAGPDERPGGDYRPLIPADAPEDAQPPPGRYAVRMVWRGFLPEIGGEEVEEVDDAAEAAADGDGGSPGGGISAMPSVHGTDWATRAVRLALVDPKALRDRAKTWEPGDTVVWRVKVEAAEPGEPSTWVIEDIEQ